MFALKKDSLVANSGPLRMEEGFHTSECEGSWLGPASWEEGRDVRESQEKWDHPVAGPGPDTCPAALSALTECRVEDAGTGSELVTILQRSASSILGYVVPSSCHGWKTMLSPHLVPRTRINAALCFIFWVVGGMLTRTERLPTTEPGPTFPPAAPRFMLKAPPQEEHTTSHGILSSN